MTQTHTLKDKVKTVYQRSKPVERRQLLMAARETFCRLLGRSADILLIMS